MRRGMDVESRQHPRVGQDEADRVLDRPCLQLVGCEEERRDRHAGGIRARALLSAARRRIRPVQVPDRQTPTVEGRARDVRPPHLVELVGRMMVDDEMTIAVVHTGVSRFAFERSPRRNGHRGLIAVGRIEVSRRMKGSQRRARVGVQDLDRKVDLEPAVAEPARRIEIGDDRARCGIDGGRRDVARPERRDRHLVEIDASGRGMVVPGRRGRRAERVSDSHVG